MLRLLALRASAAVATAAAVRLSVCHGLTYAKQSWTALWYMLLIVLNSQSEAAAVVSYAGVGCDGAAAAGSSAGSRASHGDGMWCAQQFITRPHPLCVYSDGWFSWSSWLQPRIVALASAGHTDDTVRLFRGNLANSTESRHIRTAISAAKSRGHESTAKLLFQLLALRTLPKESQNCTLLEAGASAGACDILRAIAEAGLAAKTAPEVAGRALIAASTSKSLRTSELILGHFPRASPEDAAAALVQAAQCGATDIVQTLLDLPLSPDSENTIGLCALHAACNKGHAATARLLIQRGAEVGMVTGPLKTSNCLHALLGGQQHFDCREILEVIPDHRLAELLHQPEESLRGLTPVMMALLEGSSRTTHSSGMFSQLPALIARGGELDLACTTLKGGENAFHVLCSARRHIPGLQHSLQLLLAMPGAETAVVAVNERGRTPLHHASENVVHSSTTLRFLTGRVPATQVQLQDSHGNTPLHLACKRHRAEKIVVLLQAGADATTRNHDGKDALGVVLGSGDFTDDASICMIRLLQFCPKAAAVSSTKVAVALQAALRFGEVEGVCNLVPFIADADFNLDKLFALRIWKVGALSPAYMSEIDGRRLLAVCALSAVADQRRRAAPRRPFDFVEPGNAFVAALAPLVELEQHAVAEHEKRAGPPAHVPCTMAGLRPGTLLEHLPIALGKCMKNSDGEPLPHAVKQQLWVVLRSLVRGNAIQARRLGLASTWGRQLKQEHAAACWEARRYLLSRRHAGRCAAESAGISAVATDGLPCNAAYLGNGQTGFASRVSLPAAG